MQFILHNIWYILLVLLIVAVGGGWLMFATSIGRRLMDWMKPTSDKYISTKLFCEDKQIRDRKAKVGRYVISDEKKRRSFYLVHKLLLSNPFGKGKFLALTERNARPIDFHNRITKEEWAKFPSAQRVFIDTTADLRSQSSKEATNNFMAMSLSLIAMSGAVIVIILGIIVFWQGRGS